MTPERRAELRKLWAIHGPWEFAPQGINTSLEAAERREKALRDALERNRRGYLNILEFRRLVDGRYGALTREEIEQVIFGIDDALAVTGTPDVRPNEALYDWEGQAEL